MGQTLRVDDSLLGVRLEAAVAADLTGFVEPLRSDADDASAFTAPLAGGHLVLTGPGLYVNRVLAGGIDRPPTAAELELVVDRSADVGVDAAFDVSELSHADTPAALAAAEFVPSDEVDAVALVQVLDAGSREDAELRFDVEPVESSADLQDWLDATAAGWDHVEPDRRAASDRFSRAAHIAQSPGLLLARDPFDGAVVGVAMLSIIGDVAVLGGMSTVPLHRRRGVQSALIRHRLAMAVEAGCTVAGTHAAPGGDSLRNLQRFGFRPSHQVTGWTRVAVS